MNPRLSCSVSCAGCSRARNEDPDRDWVYRASDGLWLCPDCCGGAPPPLRVVEEPTEESLRAVAVWKMDQRASTKPEADRMTLGERMKVR